MASRLVLLAAVLVAVLALAGCGGSADATDGTDTTPPLTETTQPATTATSEPTLAPTPAPKRQTIRIRVVGGRPQGGIARPKVKKGENVLLVVRSDTADEVHLHGYDISREVAVGSTVRIAFVARIPGRFEVELEQSGVMLAELTVQ